MFHTIWSKSLRDYRIAILSWGIGLGLLMLSVFASATPAIRGFYVGIAASFRFLGDPFAVQTPEGYATVRLLTAFFPLILSIWPILAGARLVRGEEERGTLDLLLATPQSRVRIILEKLAALVMALCLIAVFFTLGTIAGEPSVNAHVDVGRALLAGLNLSLLAFFFGMVALFISQFSVSRGSAVGWASGLLILAYLLDATGRVVDGTWVKYLSPFYYYNLDRPLIPSFNNTPIGALLLLGLSLLLAFLSVMLFVRRDSGRPAFTFQRTQANDNHTVERSLRKAERDVSIRTISLRALSAQSWSAFWWLLGIAVYAGWDVLLIPSIQAPLKQALVQTPILAKLFGGGDIGTNAGFLAAVVFSLMPALIVAFAMTLALTWSADLENGRLELLLGTPKARISMLLERFGAIVLLILLAPVLTWLAIMGSAQITNLSVDQNNVLAASFSMLPPALIVMSLAYALAGRLRYGAVMGILTLYITLAFVAEFLKALLNLPDWIMSLSIFHQYGNPIVNGMNWPTFLGMTGVALALLVIGLIQFRLADVERG
jgi:polyether ionophore transport system permease protein